MTTKGKVVIPGLEKGDFAPPPAAKNRLNWSVYGETKTGKSSFPLEGDNAGPAVVFDLDRRLERMVDQFVAKRPLVVNRPDFPKVDPMSRKADARVQKEADGAWDKFLVQYKMALESSQLEGGVRVISIDTATELFDLRLMAEFGRLMGINPRDRGGANAEFIEIMRMPEHYDANVVWLHHAKAEWKNYVDENGREKSTTTGQYILDGFNKANSVVQIVVRTNYNEQVKDPRKKFEVTMIRCGVNSQLNGQKWTSADWAVWDEDEKDAPPIVNYGPLAYISSLIVPGTEPEDWL